MQINRIKMRHRATPLHSQFRQRVYLETGFTKTSSNRTGPFIEVRAPYKLFLDTIKYRQEIINLIDEEVNVFDRYPGIKFGSTDEADNDIGNWE